MRQRRDRWERGAAAAAAVAAIVLAATLGLTRATDADFWWHLAAGDLVRSDGGPRHSEPFSYTARGRPWVEIHWLFQAGLSWVHERGGLRAVTLLKAGLIGGLFAWLYRRGRRSAPPAAAAAVTAWAALASQERFQARPEVLSWILMAAVLALLGRALGERARRRRRLLLWAVLPALHLPWVNIQGLFMLGPVLTALALAAAIVEEARAPAGARDPDRPADFLVGLALAAAACLVNPYGARALRLPFEQFFVHLGGNSLLSRTIAEFQPTLSADPFTPSIALFVALAAATVLALLLNLGRVRPFEALVAAATLYAALRARRNVPLFAVAAVPILLDHAGAVLRSWRAAAAPGAGSADPRPPAAPRRAAVAAAAPIAVAVTCAVLTWTVVTNRFFLAWPTERWWGIGEIPHYFPEGAARFVARSGLPGNVFHSLTAGGYLIHAWGGERPVFIDGRNDPYLDGVLDLYLRAVRDPAAFEEAVRRYQITTVLWPHVRALEGRALLRWLARGEGWVPLYLDAGGVVYARADVAPAVRLERNLPSPEAGPALYERLLGELRAAPYGGPPLREIALAEFFSVSGDPRGAETFYARAVERLPGSAPLLHGYALALERQGRIDEARALHERAVRADPGFLPSVAALGAHRLEEGRLDEAGRLIERAYRGGHRDAALLGARARLLERRGGLREAVAAHREALRRFPDDPRLLLGLARLHARHGEREAALSVFGAAARADPDDAVVAGEMAALLETLGRPAAALDVLRDAARRALRRIEARGGGWSGAGSDATGEDRRMLLQAARAEALRGEPSRAAEILAALRSAGLLDEGGAERGPELPEPEITPGR